MSDAEPARPHQLEYCKKTGTQSLCVKSCHELQKYASNKINVQ